MTVDRKDYERKHVHETVLADGEVGHVPPFRRQSFWDQLCFEPASKVELSRSAGFVCLCLCLLLRNVSSMFLVATFELSGTTFI